MFLGKGNLPISLPIYCPSFGLSDKAGSGELPVNFVKYFKFDPVM